jgi:hypothetical protein
MWSRPVTDDTGNIKRQWRTCEKCGKVVSQKVKNDGGTSDSAISEALDSVTATQKLVSIPATEGIGPAKITAEVSKSIGI